MPNHKKHAGQRPLMQVNQQKPQENHDYLPDKSKYRLNLHTFNDNRSYTPSTLRNAWSAADQNGDSQSLSPAYRRIAFTTADVPGYPAVKANSLRQPVPKKQRTTQTLEKTRLRPCKPLSPSTDMHADAWSIILAHTRPAFVMQMRTVSRFFYHITNADTVWRQAREYHFGADMPLRPPFLTERQYASLLDGRGCQNPHCERRETKKVRWVFRLRLCDECLSRKLDMTVAEREQYGINLVDLLPTSNTWGDYAALIEQYERIQEEDWDPSRVLEWAKEKYEHATTIARTAAAMDWWELNKFSDSLRAGTIRMRRQKFFVRKAQQLEDPMSEGELSCYAAYHASLASSNPPSERAWELLLAKITPYRSAAREVEKYLEHRYIRWGQPSRAFPDEIARFDKLHAHRRGYRKDSNAWTPEQRSVLNLGEEEFEKLVDHVPDEDVLLLCLRNVYNTYQKSPKKPTGLNFDGNRGEYRLSLDDARLIVEEVIEKRVKRSTLRGVRVLDSLKCMGCTRFVSGKRHSFQSAFEHMLEKHARRVGSDLHFHRFLKVSKVPPECSMKDFKFPWYLVEWPKCLPLLPTYAQITSDTRWHPDDDLPYIPQSMADNGSAFDGRRAVSRDGVSPDDFVANFVYAVQTLSTTRLDSGCMVKIAIRYATELHTTGRPSIDDFLACIRPTQETTSGLSFKFRCGACNQRPDVNSHLRCVKHSVQMNILRKHWDDKHEHEGIDWTTNFLDLPSDSDLLAKMLSQDEQLQLDQANSTERETVALKKNVKMVPDPKANALMQKELAMEAFGRLFDVPRAN